jgi:WhiB family transcriptional regulator, redox-sensing transcriptional regulator
MTARPGLQWSPGSAGPVVNASAGDGTRGLLPCASEDPDLFFTAAGESAAKAVCARCPARARCLNLAITEDLRDGVWGGLSELERRPLHNARAERLMKAGQKRCRKPPAVCANGHEWTAVNTRINSAGHTYCAECREHQFTNEVAA